MLFRSLPTPARSKLRPAPPRAARLPGPCGRRWRGPAFLLLHALWFPSCVGCGPAGVNCGGTPQRQTDQTDVCGAPLQILTSFSHLFFPVCLVYFEPTKGTGPQGSFSGSVIPRSIDSMEVLIFLRIYFLFVFFFFFLVS